MVPHLSGRPARLSLVSLYCERFHNIVPGRGAGVGWGGSTRRAGVRLVASEREARTVYVVEDGDQSGSFGASAVFDSREQAEAFVARRMAESRYGVDYEIIAFVLNDEGGRYAASAP